MKRLLFALPLVLFASQAWGQHWEELPLPPAGIESTGPDTTPAFAPYFLNTSIGFSFDAGIELTYDPPLLTGCSAALARTTNGGTSWSRINFFDSIGSSITQLCFVSMTRGYASTVPDYDGGLDAGGIFETFDQGAHWKRITKSGLSFSGVYATKDAVFASEIDTGYHVKAWYGMDSGYHFKAPVIYSYDDGATWRSIANVEGPSLDWQPHFQLIYGNRDSLVATVYFTSGDSSSGYGDIYLVLSTDLGKTWHSAALNQRYLPRPLYSAYWQSMIALHIVPHSCKIIRQFLGQMDGIDDTYSFLEAGPPFVKWDTVLPHLETGAWVAGNDCALYLSYAGPDYSHGPIERSVDGGMTWQNIGKNYRDGTSPDMLEIDDQDWQNLSTVGYGAVVYAGALTLSNLTGNWVPHFWKTTDGGDGTLSAAALAPVMALSHAPFPSGSDTLQVPDCEPSQMLVTHFNIGCSWATFDSATIAGLDPSEYSITSTHYCGCTHLPDTSFITFAPKQAGIRNVTVHFHYTDDEYNQIDTALPVVLDVTAGGVAVPISLSLGSGTMVTHAGDTIEIPIYLSSDSTLSFADTASLLLPFALDTNALKVVRFLSGFGGDTVDSLTFIGSTGTVRLHIANLTISGKTLIGTLRCVVYLADTLQTSISLQGASIDASTGGCIALSTDLTGVNIAITGCGDSTLLRFMKTGKIPLAIERIFPDPASDEVTVSLTNPSSAPITYEVIDALGLVRAEGEVSGTRLVLDVHALASGLYYLRARASSGAMGGAAASERFIVER